LTIAFHKPFSRLGIAAIIAAFSAQLHADEDVRSEVRELTEIIKSTLLEKSIPFYSNLSGKPIRMKVFDEQDPGREVLIPSGAACIIVYICPTNDNYCGIEYHGLNGIISDVDATTLVSYYMQEGREKPACTRDGAAFFEVRNVASDDALNMRDSNGPRARKIGSIPHDATCLENHGCVDGWCRVEYDHRIGWVNGAYLTENLSRAGEACITAKERLLQGATP
jgi:uncharacterized protein YraI